MQKYRWDKRQLTVKVSGFMLSSCYGQSLFFHKIPSLTVIALYYTPLKTKFADEIARYKYIVVDLVLHFIFLMILDLHVVTIAEN